MATTTKFLGTTDDVTTCDCCGRANLKSTVALSIDGADPVFFGVTCAALALKSDVKTVKRETKRADDAKRAAEDAARNAKHRAELAEWVTWLTANAPSGDCTLTRIASLGGMTAARALFNASKGK